MAGKERRVGLDDLYMIEGRRVNVSRVLRVLCSCTAVLYRLCSCTTAIAFTHKRRRFLSINALIQPFNFELYTEAVHVSTVWISTVTVTRDQPSAVKLVCGWLEGQAGGAGGGGVTQPALSLAAPGKPGLAAARQFYCFTPAKPEPGFLQTINQILSRTSRNPA